MEYGIVDAGGDGGESNEHTSPSVSARTGKVEENPPNESRRGVFADIWVHVTSFSFIWDPDRPSRTIGCDGIAPSRGGRPPSFPRRTGERKDGFVVRRAYDTGRMISSYDIYWVS